MRKHKNGHAKVLGQNKDRLIAARWKKYEEELKALAADQTAGNEQFIKLRNLITKEADLEPYIETSMFLEMLKTKFSRQDGGPLEFIKLLEDCILTLERLPDGSIVPCEKKVSGDIKAGATYLYIRQG